MVKEFIKVVMIKIAMTLLVSVNIKTKSHYQSIRFIFEYQRLLEKALLFVEFWNPESCLFFCRYNEVYQEQSKFDVHFYLV